MLIVEFSYRMKDRINKFISKGTKEGNEISLQDFIVKASAIACTRIPAANSFFMDTFIRQNNNVDISIVLKTADGNVVHPVLFDAHLKVTVFIFNLLPFRRSE